MNIQVEIFKNGECVYVSPKVQEIQSFCKEQVDTLWSEVTRFDNPHNYYVDLSQKLWNLKNKMLREHSFEEDTKIDFREE